jgi:hypothetical protein
MAVPAGKLPQNDKPDSKPGGNPEHRPHLARWLTGTVVAILIVALLAWLYATPYIALDRLKRAADARDAATVNQYVDFPSLRDSLKQQITGLLTRRLDAGGHGSPFAVIGAMIGAALIGPLVDSYATPDGVAAILNGMPPRGNPGERPPPPPAAPAGSEGAGSGSPSNDGAGGSAAPAPSQPPVAGTAPGGAPAQAPATPPQPPQTTAGYRGLNEFVVSYQHGVGDTRYSAIFRRDGLWSWKLSAVDLSG